MMYSNLAKFPAFPLAIRASSQPKCLKLFTASKSQSLPTGYAKKMEFSSYSNRRVVGLSSVENAKAVISSGSCRKIGTIQSDWRKRRIQYLKRLAPSASKEGTNKVLAERNESSKPGRSSWEESAERLEKASVKSSWEESAKRLEKVSVKSSRDEFAKRRDASTVGVRESGNIIVDAVEDQEKVDGKRLPWLASKEGNNRVWTERKVSLNPGRSSWEEPSKRRERVGVKPSSFDESAKRLENVKSSSTNEIGESSSRSVVEDQIGNYSSEVKWIEENEEEEEEEEESEIVGDPRWDKIKSRYNEAVNGRDKYERPELRRWNNQENWGRKTWKEATESSVPKMIGECVYGVGPVLAALSAGRREFYALYVQEGLNTSNNSRKKKDKKGVERILKTAQKLGLSVNRASKHDLNMVAENRPHQGLVLDASPLEMVKVKELDRVSTEEEGRSPLWVALDEVTDPQNLGAIVRSAYFFGAAGVVLCAKNSAPLSGVVSKASAGSLELMELRFCRNMMQFLIFSAENGWRVLGGSVSPSAVPLNEVAPGVPTILVLGSEGAGLRPLVEKSCTHLVRIPSNVPLDMAPNFGEVDEGSEKNSAADFRSFLAVESLNVSVAAGVLLHHLIGDSN